MQQANRAGLFNEPPARPPLPAQPTDTARPILPALAILVLLLCGLVPGTFRMMAELCSAVWRMGAALVGRAQLVGSDRGWPLQPDPRHRERAILSPCGHVPLVGGAVALPQPQKLRTLNVRSSLLVDA